MWCWNLVGDVVSIDNCECFFCLFCVSHLHGFPNKGMFWVPKTATYQVPKQIGRRGAVLLLDDGLQVVISFGSQLHGFRKSCCAHGDQEELLWWWLGWRWFNISGRKKNKKQQYQIPDCFFNFFFVHIFLPRVPSHPVTVRLKGQVVARMDPAVDDVKAGHRHAHRWLASQLVDMPTKKRHLSDQQANRWFFFVQKMRLQKCWAKYRC